MEVKITLTMDELTALMRHLVNMKAQTTYPEDDIFCIDPSDLDTATDKIHRKWASVVFAQKAAPTSLVGRALARCLRD